jgi:S-disulfanyl-L-cysteine oxidoreductase SoxD
MSFPRKIAIAVIVGSLSSTVWAYDFGRSTTPAEISLWDIDVLSDGAGLPKGSGTAARGKEVYQQNCEICHGPNGEGGTKNRLVGGEGTLATDSPIKTVGSYWPYATTVFDYIRRAMPYPAPGTLSNDDTYALVAYLLSLNGILLSDGRLDQDTLAKIKMPNRDGFIPDPVFELDNEQEGPIKSKGSSDR